MRTTTLLLLLAPAACFVGPQPGPRSLTRQRVVGLPTTDAPFGILGMGGFLSFGLLPALRGANGKLLERALRQRTESAEDPNQFDEGPPLVGLPLGYPRTVRAADVLSVAGRLSAVEPKLLKLSASRAMKPITDDDIAAARAAADASGEEADEKEWIRLKAYAPLTGMAAYVKYEDFEAAVGAARYDARAAERAVPGLAALCAGTTPPAAPSRLAVAVAWDAITRSNAQASAGVLRASFAAYREGGAGAFQGALLDARRRAGTAYVFFGTLQVLALFYFVVAPANTIIPQLLSGEMSLPGLPF